MKSQQQQCLGAIQLLELERQVIARLRRGGRRIFLLGEFSRHLVAYARQRDLLLEQWTAIWKRDHMRGVNFGNVAIIAAPGFTKTWLWRDREGLGLLAIAQSEGALLLYSDGTEINLQSHPQHPDAVIEPVEIDETPLRLRGQTSWDESPVTSPIDLIHAVMELYRDATGINARPINFTEENGQIVFRAGDQVLQRYNIPGVQGRQPVYATCTGCVHYDGAVYGGNRLICAMYPYGPESESCPDRQTKKTAD